MDLPWSILRLTRTDTVSLIALSVFLPIVSRTRDLTLGLERSLPLAFIAACTFIANDLDDLERDRINHPSRPLPAGTIGPRTAVLLYFACLMIALFSIKHLIPPVDAYPYYFLLLLNISYQYVAEHLPLFKPGYVASLTAVPILIVAALFSERGLYLIAVAVSLFVLGRELCMDLLDRLGDQKSLLQKVSPRVVALIAFAAQATALLLLVSQVEGLIDLALLVLVMSAHAGSVALWFRSEGLVAAVRLMKIQLFLGLLFLI